MTETLPETARLMLNVIAPSEKGMKLEGREDKKDADRLAARGLVSINKSRTRATITPAGRFAATERNA